jgi:hypothetical protein
MGISIQSPPIIRETYTWLAGPAPAEARGSYDGSFSCTCSGNCTETITCQDNETCDCVSVAGAYDCRCLAK